MALTIYTFYKIKKVVKGSKYLMVHQPQKTKFSILRWVQAKSFYEEIKTLESDKEILRTSKDQNLHPFIKKDLIFIDRHLEYSTMPTKSIG